ncbi:MAG: hypothetical protein HOC70_00885, partial [Gammaproteobacteria bacterium]|nr:hypothetical protein [Gammaproteobacteria bacterium]
MNHLLRLACLIAVSILAACATNSVGPLPPTLITDDIVKSPNDSRDYRYLVLANGLGVVLISDPKADKSAASLTVFRGSFDDPEDRPGLAHFLEHMLFIGTEKYPEPDGYFSFVQAHGGSSNAYTASEHTNYFFDVQPEAFPEGLDRFAHFFISPLFQQDYVEREKNAVNSEYKLQLKEDSWRGFAVRKLASNPDHPVSEFNIGTLETLSGDVHGALLKFFEEQYSANEMGLVVLSRDSLDELQPWIVELFSQIENRNLDNIERQGPLYTDAQLPATLRHDNLKDSFGVTYTFPIPPIGDLYRKKPMQYLANLIGHEGEGSLHKLLSDRGWINSLGAGESEVDDNHAMMAVSIELTEIGAVHIPEVSAYLFAYLEMLRGRDIEQWIYDEQARVAELGFRFAEKTSAIGVVRMLAPNLENYPAEDLLVAPYLMEEFDGPLIREFLNFLTPDNVVVSISRPGYVGKLTEKWFGVSYDLIPGPIELASVEESRLALPDPNPFLPESVALVDADEDMPLPVITGQDAEVYVDTDLEFGVPRAVTHISLRNPGGLIALENAARARLYAMLVQDDLNALAYPALLAGVSYQIASPPKGFRVSISGYEDKQFVLLDEVLTRLINLEIPQDRFDVLKTELLKALQNAEKDKPYLQAYQRLQDELMESAWTPTELISIVEGLTIDDLTNWREGIFNKVSMQALVHGNVLDEKAESLRDLVQRHVPLTEVVVGEPGVKQVVGVRRERLSVDHDDAAMVLYVQDESTSFDDRARSSFLTHLIAPGYFSSLRTEQQLGYIVFAANTVFYDRGGISFIVQSPVVGPFELRNRTLAFMEAQVDRLAEMSEEEFGANKGG